MLTRKLYTSMKRWKNEEKGRSSLFISGARRVGKSFLCNLFAKNEYDTHIMIDFANVSSDVIEIFERDSWDLDIFFMKLQALYNTILVPRKSVFIFDEIQQYNKARQLLKYLVQDGRYDYIATGSLLSIKENVQDIVIPSEEYTLDLYPLDFEEFLYAMEEVPLFTYIKKAYTEKIEMGQALHRKALNLFRQYMLVGGMPQAVMSYKENRDFAEVDRKKRAILKLYRADVGKFAGIYKNKVTSIFDEIPAQLSKKEKRFNLAALTSQARMREYEDAFLWLDDAMIVNTCYKVNDPNVGLSLSMETAMRKIYMADTGLLVTQVFMDKSFSSNNLYRDILLDKISCNEGMLTENIVAQQLRAAGNNLFFYSKNDKINRANHMEIDFILTKGRKIMPIEVKSSTYRKHSSLDKFMTKFSQKVQSPIILYAKDVMMRLSVLHLPIYMAGLLHEE